MALGVHMCARVCAHVSVCLGCWEAENWLKVVFRQRLSAPLST